jgi:hypothetical protein
MHTASLVVMGRKDQEQDEESFNLDVAPPSASRDRRESLVNRAPALKRTVSNVKREIEKLEKAINIKEVPVAVVEQRVSNLVQGAFCESASETRESSIHCRLLDWDDLQVWF